MLAALHNHTPAPFTSQRVWRAIRCTNHLLSPTKCSVAFATRRFCVALHTAVPAAVCCCTKPCCYPSHCWHLLLFLCCATRLNRRLVPAWAWTVVTTCGSAATSCTAWLRHTMWRSHSTPSPSQVGFRAAALVVLRHQPTAGSVHYSSGSHLCVLPQGVPGSSHTRFFAAGLC